MKRVLMLLTNPFTGDPRVENEARSLVKSGYDVAIIAWDRECRSEQEEVVDGIKVHRVQLKSDYADFFSILTNLPCFWSGAFFRSMRMDFDIIHCHDLDTLPIGLKIGRLKGVPVVYDAHESYPDMIVRDAPSCVSRFLFRFEDWFLKRVDYLVTVGETLKDEMVRRGARKAAVVGSWKDPKDFAFPNKEVLWKRRELGIPDDALAIVYIGFFFEFRKVLEMIEAVKRSEDVYFILGGYKGLEDEVKKAVEGEERIKFLGPVKGSDVPLYTAMSDVLYYCPNPAIPDAKYSAPNKLFEALAAGKALLVTDIGELGRIVKEEKCGVIVKEPTIEEMVKTISTLKDKSQLEKMKENARKAGQDKYNLDNAGKVLAGVYEELLS